VAYKLGPISDIPRFGFPDQSERFQCQGHHGHRQSVSSNRNLSEKPTGRSGEIERAPSPPESNSAQCRVNAAGFKLTQVEEICYSVFE
jgi:hypothetical protein